MSARAVISRWEALQLEYGSTDCCQFAAYVVKQLTGRNVIPWAYYGEAEAQSILDQHGGLQGAVDEVLGPMRPASVLSDGDVALVGVGGEVMLGIHLGTSVAILRDNGRPIEANKRLVIGGWPTCPA